MLDPGDVLDEQPLSDHFRAFAAVVERDGGTTYAAICRGVADDADVLSLLDGAPPPSGAPSCCWRPCTSCCSRAPSTRWPPTTTPWAACVGRCGPARRRTSRRSSPTSAVTHRAELERLIATRTTQTNEVGRCTALLAGSVPHRSLYGWDEPLSLLDLGTSAGLNLLFDDYAYTYRAAGGRQPIAPAGVATSAVALECAARDDLDHLPELRLPAMAERVGLDLSPVDPFSDDEARWLLACQWPDNPVRFGRLRAALANVRAAPRPPRLERGDMVTDLARVAATIPGDDPLVVFHSWVAAYLDEDAAARPGRRGRARSARDRPVHHLYCETPFETPGLPTPPSPVPRDGPDLATALVHIGPGGATRCGWPTPTRTATGSAGGLAPTPSRPAPTARRAGPAPARPPR